MSVIHLKEQPSLDNTLRNPEAVSVSPIYATVEVLARMFAMSSSTAKRLVNKAEEQGFDDIRIRVSSSKTIYKISRFEEYLISIDSKYL